MRAIFLIMIGFSTFVFANFTKNGDIVTDTTTGLQWQDDADTKNLKKTWQEAIDYCENLTLVGHDDWRLPNINELKSIVDRSKHNPAIADGFTNVIHTYYSYPCWSSTSHVNYNNNALFVYFTFGRVKYTDKNVNFYVRCVRDGQ